MLDVVGREQHHTQPKNPGDVRQHDEAQRDCSQEDEDVSGSLDAHQPGSPCHNRVRHQGGGVRCAAHEGQEGDNGSHVQHCGQDGHGQHPLESGPLIRRQESPEPPHDFHDPPSGVVR